MILLLKSGRGLGGVLGVLQLCQQNGDKNGIRIPGIVQGSISSNGIRLPVTEQSGVCDSRLRVRLALLELTKQRGL